ncbi:hypothetical protein QW131_15385 [Roseibium salinum]|nr:hypothetical protein [Roseibium salinum]
MYLDANPDFGRDDEGFDELCPWEDNRTIHDFARWYAMKVRFPYDRNNYGTGTALAKAVVNGVLPSLSAPETRAYAEKEHSEDISFSGEGRL